jgi:hypothetical protein
MNVGELAHSGDLARRGLTGRFGRLAPYSPIRVFSEVLARTFRGSRAELEHTTALRLQAAVVLLFLAVRCVHLGQAGIDLSLASHRYSSEGLAVALGAACVVESVAIAAVTLRARRLTERAILADAAFGAAGLMLMSVASSSGPGRAGSLNWMLPYTVATATGLGVLAVGDLVQAPLAAGAKPEGIWRSFSQALRRRWWSLAVALLLGCTYVASAYLPRRLSVDHPGQIWGNAANYPVFFVAGALTLVVTRRHLVAMAARNAEVSAAAAGVARDAQWRAVVVDVFGPVLELLDRVVLLPDGELPLSVRHEAERLIAMIDAVRPGDASSARDQSTFARE